MPGIPAEPLQNVRYALSMRFRRILLLVVLLLIAGGITFYERPLWTEQQWTHLSLFAHRVQSNYVLTDSGYRVHYYEAEPRFAPGHGVPLVLIHGLADRDESWAPMLKRLKKAGFHVYAPDLLGYGRSPKPADGDYSIAGQEKYIADFIQALGLQKPHVAGWSMGGWIALKLALDHPDMVDRVVVYDAAGVRAGMPAPGNTFDINTPEDVDRLVAKMEPEAKPLPRFVARDAVRRFQENEPITQRYLTSMTGGKDLLDDKLSQLTSPLLIVWGSEDKLTPLAVGQAMHSMVKTSELDVLEGCGHLSPLICDVRAASATADFLKSNPVPQGGERTLANMGKHQQ